MCSRIVAATCCECGIPCVVVFIEVGPPNIYFSENIMPLIEIHVLVRKTGLDFIVTMMKLTDHVSESGNAIASVCPSVCLFPLYFGTD